MIFFIKLNLYIIKYRSDLGKKQNDKNAAINIYFTNQKLDNSGKTKRAFSIFKGICKKDEFLNVALISAPFEDTYELKPSEYNQEFPSIATHSFVYSNLF